MNTLENLSQYQLRIVQELPFELVIQLICLTVICWLMVSRLIIYIFGDVLLYQLDVLSGLYISYCIYIKLKKYLYIILNQFF